MTEVIMDRPREAKEPPDLSLTGSSIKNVKALKCNWFMKVISFEEKRKEIIFKKRNSIYLMTFFFFLSLMIMSPLLFIRNRITLFLLSLGLILLFFSLVLLITIIDMNIALKSPNIKQTAMVYFWEKDYHKKYEVFTEIIDIIRKRSDLKLIDNPIKGRFLSNIKYIFQNGNEISVKFKDFSGEGLSDGWIKIRYHFKYYEHALEVQKIMDDYLFSKRITL